MSKDESTSGIVRGADSLLKSAIGVVSPTGGSTADWLDKVDADAAAQLKDESGPDLETPDPRVGTPVHEDWIALNNYLDQLTDEPRHASSTTAREEMLEFISGVNEEGVPNDPYWYPKYWAWMDAEPSAFAGETMRLP
jgi:hypothetical protein